MYVSTNIQRCILEFSLNLRLIHFDNPGNVADIK